MEEEAKGKGVSRRDFLKGLGGGAIGTAVISTGLLDPGKVEAYPTESIGTSRGKSAVNLKVNGKAYRLEVEHRETLAEALRDQLGFTGKKIGCDRGECGACTVMLDGRMQDDATFKQAQVMVQTARMIAERDPEYAELYGL